MAVPAATMVRRVPCSPKRAPCTHPPSSHCVIRRWVLPHKDAGMLLDADRVKPTGRVVGILQMNRRPYVATLQETDQVPPGPQPM